MQVCSCMQQPFAHDVRFAMGDNDCGSGHKGSVESVETIAALTTVRMWSPAVSHAATTLAFRFPTAQVGKAAGELRVVVVVVVVAAVVVVASYSVLYMPSFWHRRHSQGHVNHNASVRVRLHALSVSLLLKRLKTAHAVLEVAGQSSSLPSLLRVPL